MEEKEYYKEIAHEKTQVLLEFIRNRIAREDVPVGQIENSIGVSKGYFSRVSKKEKELKDGKDAKGLDIAILCKLVEYFGLDYNVFFFPPLDNTTIKENSADEMVWKFLKYLEISTAEKQIIWTHRLNMVITSGVYVPSQGIRLGIYGDNYKYDPEEKETGYLRYELFANWFECSLQDGETVKLYKIWDTEKNKEEYEILLNGELLYATISGNGDRSEESSKIIKSLYLYLLENRNNTDKKKLPSLDAMEIIKKYCGGITDGK